MAATVSVHKIHHLESDSAHKAGAKEQAQFLAFPRRKRFMPSRLLTSIFWTHLAGRPWRKSQDGYIPSAFLFQES